MDMLDHAAPTPLPRGLQAARATQSSAAKRAGVYVYLLALGLTLLPLTRAFTIDVGFPLKLYEPVFGAAAATFLFSDLRFGRELLRKFMLPLGAFVIVAVISYLLLIFANEATQYTFRGGAALDGLARVGYLALNVAIFIMCAVAAKAHSRDLMRAWIIGACVAASYALFTSFQMTTEGEALLLPGLERHQLWSLGPLTITRSGTFEEGNFAGLYFLVTLTLAFYARTLTGFAFALAGLLVSISTSAYIGLLAAAAVYVLAKRSGLVIIPYLLLICVLGFFVIDYFVDQGKFEVTNSSGAVRLNEIMTAWGLFIDHIWVGAGLGQYGFQYDYYVWNSAVNELATSDRHIVNNVYMEVLTETGIFGFVFAAIFIKNWVIKLLSLDGRARVFFAGAVGLLVGWLAYPTFSMAFLWAYMGLVIGIASSIEAAKQSRAAQRRLDHEAGSAS